jgi:hypothetical protein
MSCRRTLLPVTGSAPTRRAAAARTRAVAATLASVSSGVHHG